MIISPNKIVGSLVYRTKQALNHNREFMSRIARYPYQDNCFANGEFNVWHYVGTPNEISRLLLDVSEDPNGSLIKFPCILDFKPNTEDYVRIDGIQFVRVNFKLAIAASSNSRWITEQREEVVFDPLLRPVYKEFMRQIVLAKDIFHFDGIVTPGVNYPPHRKIEVYTTGDNQNVFVEWYGEVIDALEIHNLDLMVKTDLCARYRQEIEDQNSKVTESINQILNC